MLRRVTICTVIREMREMVDNLKNEANQGKVEEFHERAEEAELYAKKMAKKLVEYAGADWEAEVFKDFKDNEELIAKYPFRNWHLLDG